MTSVPLVSCAVAARAPAAGVVDPAELGVWVTDAAGLICACVGGGETLVAAAKVLNWEGIHKGFAHRSARMKK